MAEQADAPEREDEELHQPEPEGLEPEAHEPEEPDDPADIEAAAEPEEGEDDDLEISFGDEAAPASRGSDSDLVRHLRAEVRKRDEELTAFRAGKIQPAQPQTIEVGQKPTLETCDYDEAKFETELDAWKERKAKADQAQAQATQRAQAVQERFATKLQAFSTGRQALKVKDFELAEAAVLAGLTQVQQAVVIQAADDSAKLVYALGRHPEKLKALAAIDDPIEFTKAMVKLEGQLKVTQRARTPLDPDRPARGSAPLSGADKKLERLEAEASRTGDRTKVIAYKREQRLKGRA